MKFRGAKYGRAKCNEQTAYTVLGEGWRSETKPKHSVPLSANGGAYKYFKLPFTSSMEL